MSAKKHTIICDKTKVKHVKIIKHQTLNSTAKRTQSSRIWLTRHINDQYVQMAKIDGFISRAAYKLLQADMKFNLIAKANRILDIGSAPGSWLQVILKTMGKHAKVVGIDLNELAINIDDHANNMIFICDDFTSESAQLTISKHETQFDLIVSDMSPNTIGQNDANHFAIVSLIESLELFILRHLSKHGNIMYKMFQGCEQHIMIAKAKKYFKSVHCFKPHASRKESSEFYIVGLDFNGGNKLI